MRQVLRKRVAIRRARMPRAIIDHAVFIDILLEQVVKGLMVNVVHRYLLRCWPLLAGRFLGVQNNITQTKRTNEN